MNMASGLKHNTVSNIVTTKIRNGLKVLVIIYSKLFPSVNIAILRLFIYIFTLLSYLEILDKYLRLIIHKVVKWITAFSVSGVGIYTSLDL